MIGVSDQYLFSFNLGGKKDFITEDSLESFITIERAGFSLPEFELEFNTDDESILPMLNEGTPLGVQYGATRDNMTDVKLSISNFPIIKEGKTKRTYVLSGFCHDISYINEPRNQITGMMSGVEAGIKAASKYFKPYGNATTGMDRQRWIQARQTDAHFIKECVLHSMAKNNSFFGVAITTGRELVIKDIKESLRQKNYDWRFIEGVIKDAKDVLYDPNFVIESKAGVISSLMGYGREKIVYDIENGSSKTVLEKSKPILSLSRDLAMSKEIQKRNASLGIINENVHSNYHEAFQRNITNLLTLSSVAVTASLTGNKFVPIRPLDIIMFKDKSTEGNGDNQTSEYHSGLYLASVVSKELKQRRYTTTVEMCRESFNQVRT